MKRGFLLHNVGYHTNSPGKEVKLNVGQLVDAVASGKIEQFAGQITDQLRQQIVTLLEKFAGNDPRHRECLTWKTHFNITFENPAAR